MNLSAILEGKGVEVVTSAPHRTLGEIVSILSEKRIGAMVVVGSDGEVLGMISERDVIRALANRGDAVLHDAVSKHMTSRVIAAHRDMTVNEAMGRMTNGRFRHMPVVEDGRLVGMISIGDVNAHYVSQQQQQITFLSEYIYGRA